MESRCVDVFISHKMEDAEKAQHLKRRIESFGLAFWIDADDEEMERIQKNPSCRLQDVDRPHSRAPAQLSLPDLRVQCQVARVAMDAVGARLLRRAMGTAANRPL